ncbi:Alkaline phosphatase [Hypsibius exemplaris]|uniref:alkaline phosphatase n=1 Tax=Hypsibius exemplaris TaxID=2072580 RepID=A0A1W0X4S6_HYPEX|nr:Alkaline phosphatase [Hypsibius exemplaris]
MWSHCAFIAGVFLLLLSDRRVASEDPETWWSIGQEELRETLRTVRNVNKAKNVVVFVGDGMGVTTVTAARILQGQLKGASGEEGYLYFEKFPHTGLLKAYSNNMQVSESSASGTALFSGQKVNSDTVGLSSKATPKQCRGSQEFSIDGLLQWAQANGKSTGAVTTTRVTHSTPAGLYAHCANEDWEADTDIPSSEQDGHCKDVATQLVETSPGNRLDVLMGGGWTKFLPNVPNAVDGPTMKSGCRADGRNLIEEWLAEKRRRGGNHSFVDSRESLLQVDPKTDSLLGLFSAGAMNPKLGRAESSTEPELKEMAVKAVEILAKNPNGYFLMVEGGLIDDSHHRGLAARALHETIAFAETVQAVDAITNSNDTLLIVVADHSHALIFTGYQKRGTSILGFGSRKLTDQKPFTSLLYLSGKGSSGDVPRRNISADNTTAPDYQQQAFLPTPWAMHLGEDVPIFAKGPWSHLFVGVHEQHYVAHAINYAACLRNDTLTSCDSNDITA